MAQAGSLFFKLIPQMDSSALSAEARKAGQAAGAPLGQAMGSVAGNEAGKALSASSRSMQQAATDMGTKVSAAIGKPLGTAFNPLGAASDWALKQINRIPPGVGSAMGTIYGHAVNAGNGIVDVFTRSTQQATQTFQTWGQKLKTVISAPVTALSGMLASFGISGGLALGALGGAALTAGVRFDSLKEQATIAFTTMMKDSGKAQAFVQQLADFAAKTPFEFPGLLQSAQRLMAFGVKAQDVIPTMTAIGDAVSGLGGSQETLNRVTLALGQMMAKGKVQSDEILQLTEAGIPALRILANEMGITTGELSDMIKKGQVTSEKAIPLLLKGMEEGTKGAAGETQAFGGMMEKQATTMAGVWSNFKDKFQQTMGNLVQPVLPYFSKGMDLMLKMFDKIPAATGFLKTAFQPVIDFVTGPLLTAGRNLWDAFGPYITPLVQLVGVALVGAWRLLGDALSWFGGLLVSVTGWLKDHQLAVQLIVGFVGGYVAALTALNAITLLVRGAILAWTAAQWLLDAALNANPIGIIVGLLTALVVGLVYAYNHSETFRNIVQGAWNGIKSAAETAWNFLKGVFDALSTAVSAVGDWFGQMGASAAGAWRNLTDIVSTGWQLLVDKVWTPMVTFFTVTIPAAWAGLTAAVSAVWNGIVEVIKFAVTLILTIILAPLVIFFNAVLKPAFENFLATVQTVWNGISTVVSTVWNFLMNTVFIPLGDLLGTKLTGFVNYWRDTAIAAWNNIRDGVAAVWNLLMNTVFIPLGDWMGTKLTGFVNYWRDTAIAAWNNIRDGINAAWAFIRDNIWQPIVNFINNVLIPIFNTCRDALVAAWNAIKDGINAAWQLILNNIWQPIVNFINNVLIPVFNTCRDALVAAWNAIKDGINAVWIWIRDNIWNPIVTFITVTIPNAFQTGVDAIKRLWNGVKAALRDPLQAAINVIWNQGIVKVWNMVADLVGLGTRLSEYNLPAFAAGGPVTGGVPGKDSVPLLAEPGEYVLSKATVIGLGGLAVVDMINRMFGSGRRAGDIGFQGGGSVAGASATGSASTVATGSAQAVSVLSNWMNGITDALGKVADVVRGAGRWGELLVGFGKKIASSVVDFLTEKVKAFLATVVSAVGGGTAVAPTGPIRDIVQQTAAQFGWGSGAQWDALVWIINHESGWNPNAQNLTSTAYGLFQFLNGTWGSTGIGKTSNPALQALAGMRYIASRYGSPVGAQSFWQRNGWYDQGGLLPTGWSFAYNGTGAPEPVIPADRFAQLTRGARGGDGALIGVLNLTVPQGASAQDVVDELSFALRHSRRGLHARSRR